MLFLNSCIKNISRMKYEFGEMPRCPPPEKIKRPRTIKKIHIIPVTPEEIVLSLPEYRVWKRSPYLDSDYQCHLCLQSYVEGEYVKCLPCRHKFHRYCIENWLLWARDTCPIDYTPVYNTTSRDESPTLEESQFLPNLPPGGHNSRRLKKRHSYPYSDQPSPSPNSSGRPRSRRVRSRGSPSTQTSKKKGQSKKYDMPKFSFYQCGITKVPSDEGYKCIPLKAPVSKSDVRAPVNHKDKTVPLYYKFMNEESAPVARTKSDTKPPFRPSGKAFMLPPLQPPSTCYKMRGFL